MALRAPDLGGARLTQAHDVLGGIEALLSSKPAELSGLGLSKKTIQALKSPDTDLLESDLEWLQNPNHHLITWADDDYPALLRKIPSPPAALFVQGNVSCLWQPQLAVIGSRNPTAGGISNGKDFAGELSRLGLTITSGLAEGIDTIAHQAALDKGGNTVAVTGCGLDRVYPAKNQSLAQSISTQGAVISELPLGAPPLRQHFPARNRIISGLSLGVLVIEAGLNSGTLITARLAAEQGREVFALPGSIHNPMAKGCHRLLREGAKLVETAAEVMEELAPLAYELAMELQQRIDHENEPTVEKEDNQPQFELDAEYRTLLSSLGYDPRTVDQIIEQSGLTAQAVSSMLLMLELRGMVESHPGGAYNLKPRG